MTKNNEDYTLYQRCKYCGQILTDDEIWDNGGLCDYCFNEVNTWRETPFGGYNEEQIQG